MAGNLEPAAEPNPDCAHWPATTSVHRPRPPRQIPAYTFPPADLIPRSRTHFGTDPFAPRLVTAGSHPLPIFVRSAHVILRRRRALFRQAPEPTAPVPDRSRNDRPRLSPAVSMTLRPSRSFDASSTRHIHIRSLGTLPDAEDRRDLDVTATAAGPRRDPPGSAFIGRSLPPRPPPPCARRLF